MEDRLKVSTTLRTCPLWDLPFPKESFISGKPVPENSPYRYLTQDDARQIILAKPPHCHTCGHPFWGDAAEDQQCPHCVELKPVFAEGRTGALMKGPARDMIIDLKYHNGFHVIPELVAMAAQCPGYLDFLDGGILVPVPLHWFRFAGRGYNQSQKLALALAERANGCRVKSILRRTRYTSTQTKLQRKHRVKNMEGAFQVKRNHGLSPHDRIILIDDVFTTGSTLNSCAKALLQKGFQHIDVATLCHG